MEPNDASDAGRNEEQVLRARAEALELEIARGRRRLAKLQGLPEPRVAATLRTPETASSYVHVERRLARVVPERALEGFVAAVQTRLSAVGWSRREARGLTWQSSADKVGIELRVSPGSDATTLAITYDPSALTLVGRLGRVQGASIAIFGMIGAVWLGCDAHMLVSAIVGGASAVLFGGLVAWLGSKWADRRRVEGLAQLERLGDALAGDLAGAADLAARSVVARVDADEAPADASPSVPDAREVRRALP